MPLQELRILEMLPFDRRIVQFYGSCTKGSNILLVLELMQVTASTRKCPVPYEAMSASAAMKGLILCMH